MNTPTVVLLALTPLIVWRIHARVRRMVSHFALSPATPAIFGTLAGYYVAHAIGLLRWRRAKPQ